MSKRQQNYIIIGRQIFKIKKKKNFLSYEYGIIAALSRRNPILIYRKHTHTRSPHLRSNLKPIKSKKNSHIHEANAVAESPQKQT